jgi:hypothetical protein
MAYDSQQDPIDGDRRDVPVETSTAGHYPSDNGARVESRSFSAMLAPPEAIRSPQKVQVAPAGDSVPSDSNGSHDSNGPRSHTDAHETSSRIDWSGMPGRWIWRVVLRTDSLLVDTLRSMLMLDPKPDRFRARN